MATEAITYSHPAGATAESAFASGLLTTDGTAVNIICGFQPTKIVLTDYTETNVDIVLWVKGQPVASSTFLTGSTGVTTKVTGPAVYSDTDGEGFTIPAALLTDQIPELYPSIFIQRLLPLGI